MPREERYPCGRLRIRVRPGKKNDRLSLLGEEFCADISALAREGAANDLLVRNLSRWLSWPISKVRLEKGKTARFKTIEIEGLTDEEIEKKLLGWIRSFGKND